MSLKRIVLLSLVTPLAACASQAHVQSDDNAPQALSSSALPTSGQAYRIISAGTGKSLDVTNADPTDGVWIQQWTYYGGTNQRWTFTPQANGTYEIASVATQSCIDIYNNQPTDGTRIQQWVCIGQGNQQWALNQLQDGNFTIVAKDSGKCLDVDNNSTADGATIQQWGCWGGANQEWLIQAIDSSGNVITSPSTPSTPSGPTTSNFGNISLHPEKIGFYMVPDLAPAYTNWSLTEASLAKVHQLLPNAWIRWDNETGHYSDDQGSVEAFTSSANTAGVGMIVTGSAVDGYNNWWANGNAPPNASLIDFANGPYLSFAAHLANTYPVVKFVETANEPDGPWFNNDGDNVGDFDYYLGKLQSAMGGSSRILGPAVASIYSQIWANYVNTASNVSYHTYGGWQALTEISNHSVYVTEYGGFNLDPAAVLADLYAAETNGKLSNTITKLFYQQITDNGGNRGAMNSTAQENGHFAFRDWFRALTLWQAVGNVSISAYANTGVPDFVASDDNHGNFAMLLWNNSAGTESGQNRTVTGTSIGSAGSLNVVIVQVGDYNTAQCTSLGGQGAVQASVSGGQVSVNVNQLPPHAAVLLTTQSCTNLAN